VSGGVPTLLYSLTGAASREDGTVRLPDASAAQYLRFVGQAAPSWMSNPDQYQTWNGTGQVTATLSPKATVTVSHSLTSSTQQRSSMDMTSVGSLIGVLVDTTKLETSPLMKGFLERVTTDETTSRSTGTAQWTPRSWLRLQFTGGVDDRGRRSKSYMPSGLPKPLLVLSGDSSGRYSSAREDASTTTGNTNATVTIPLPHSASLTVATGFDVTKTQNNLLTVETTSLPVGVTDPMNFALGVQTGVYQTSAAQTTYGWFIEPQLHLSERFTISPGIRLDGGSASGSNAGFTVFPKTSVSWLALDESGTGTPAWWRWALSSLRLRGAYGLAGVQPDPTARLRLYTVGTTILNGTTPTNSAIPYSVGNTEIRPERSSEVEAGFDADLFDSRASVTFTTYHKRRLNAIVSMTLAPSAGSGTQSVNVGTVTSGGVEVTASARLLDRPAVQWNVNMSFATSHDALVSLGHGVANAYPGGPNSRLVPGYPIDGVWARRLIGYNDANSDGIIESDELVFSDSASYLGSQDPNYTSSLGSTVAFFNGRLSFNANLAYTDGLTQDNTLGLTELRSAVSQPNPTLQQEAVYLATANPPANATPYALYQTVNTLRLQSASISYVLPAAVARAFRSTAASISLQGSNLWLHTNYRGKDPDVNGFTSGEGVADFGQIPEPRLWILSVRLN
jgi:outer membrane receptor protein involved in Fe transport